MQFMLGRPRLNTVQGKILEWEKIGELWAFFSGSYCITRSAHLKRFNRCLTQPCSQHILRSLPSTTSVLHDKSWCICKKLVNQSQKVQFHYKKHANSQIMATCFVKRLQTKFLLLIMRLQNYLYILHGLLNRPSQLIHQYFILVYSPIFYPSKIFPRTLCKAVTELTSHSTHRMTFSILKLNQLVTCSMYV